MKLIRVRFAAQSSSLEYGGLDGLLDMLRYSAGWPYQQEDATTIGMATRGEGPGAISFQIAKYIDDQPGDAESIAGDAETIADGAFSFDRWEAFGFVPMEVDGIPTQRQIGKAIKAAYGS